MAKQKVPVYTVTSGDRVERARSSLAEALGGAKLGKPDEGGIFAVPVDAETPEEAREMVREAFARAGTGDDFVIQETTEGREIADDDPRQGGVEEGTAGASAAADATAEEEETAEAGAAANGDRSNLVADAASAVAAAASDAGSSDAADSAKGAASSAADTARDAASSVREAVDEKGIGGAATDYASTAASAAQKRDLTRFAPIGGLLLLLLILRRRRR